MKFITLQFLKLVFVIQSFYKFFIFNMRLFLMEMEFVAKMSSEFYVFFHNNEICFRKGLILQNSNLLVGKEKLNLTISEFSNFKFEYSKVFVSLYLKKNFYLCFATIKF